MDARVLLGLTALWGVAAALSVVIHFLVICPRLYRNGARFPTGFLPWRIFHDMHRYRELSRAVGDSLNPYYVYLILLLFSIGFGVVIGLLHLQRWTSPY
jgi:predicted PurR-regulated permease PerM